MAKNFTSNTTLLTTSESDIYIASGKTMTLLIQVVNNGSSDVSVNLWITDGSNNHIAPLLADNTMIEIKGGKSDNSKHVLQTGHKIRGVASIGSSVYVEISALEGM